METTCIALLRGVNVGGRNKLPMKQLVAIVEGIGGRQVRTYIQSGNVVFTAPSAIRRGAAASISSAIEQQLDISTPVVLRTVEQLRHVVAANPYLGPDQDERALHVAFLADPPRSEDVATLDEHRSPPDEFTLKGQEIYLRCPNGLARTKLSNSYFDSRLKTTSTVRNWRTTLKLLEFAEELTAS